MRTPLAPVNKGWQLNLKPREKNWLFPSFFVETRWVYQLLFLEERVSPSARKVMNFKCSNSKDAFTLVETVLAVMILSIALGACILSFSMAMRTVNTASNQMAALHYARDQLEGLRTNAFTDLSSTLRTNSVPANFTISYAISTVDAYTKNITVNVTYLNRLRGGISTNTLTTSVVSTLHP